MRPIIAGSLFAAFLFAPLATGDVNAQASDAQRQRRRDFVENLLQGLLESQTQPRAQPQHQHGGPANPPRPGAGHFPPRGGGVVVESSREMTQAREYLNQWSRSCQELVKELKFHEHESPRLRPFLADALKIQTSIDSLRNKAGLYPTLSPLTNEFSAIDQQWRMLAYRLKRSGALTAQCNRLVDSIANVDSKMGNLFQMQPQPDRNELLRLTTEFSSHYKHLLQDVYYQTRNTRDGASLLRQGQELHSTINQSAALIPRGNYDAIVAGYRQCYQGWRDYSRKLRTLSDERIQRDIQEINLIGGRIHEQLWLPVEMDREYVGHLAESIYAESEHMFGDVSVTQLLKMGNPEQVLSTVRSFQNSCRSFSRGVEKGKTPDELAWDFWLFEKQWNKVETQFGGFKVAAINQHLEEVKHMLTTLGQSLGAARGQGASMSQQELVQIAANLDQLCHQFNEDVHHRIDRRRYDRDVLKRLERQSEALHESAHDFHRNLISSRNSDVDSRQLADVFQAWNRLRPFFKEFRPADQATVNEFRRQTEPLMVKLQVVFVE